MKKSLLKKVLLTIIRVLIYLAIVGMALLVVFAKQIFGEDSEFYNAVHNLFNIDKLLAIYLPHIFMTVVAIVAVDLASKYIRKLLIKIIHKSNGNKTALILLSNFIKYISAIIITIIILSSIGVDMTTLLAGVGIIGLAIGLGAQSLIEDIIAGIFIVFEKTFAVGDIVEIGGFRGSVKEVGIRTVKIVDIGGDTKIVNNSKIGDVINMTKLLSVASTSIQIEYGDSIERVESLIAENLPKITNKIPGIIEGPFYVGVDKLDSSGVELKFIASCNEADRMPIIRQMNRLIKIMFDENNISIAYPHIVVNDNRNFPIVTDNEKTSANDFLNNQLKSSADINNND